LAGIENEVSGVISDLFGDFFGIDLIVILPLIPVNGDFIVSFKFREIVEGIEVAEGVSPGEIAPAMSGEDGGYLILFWGAKVGYVPNTLFEKLLPVFALVNFAPNTNGFDNETAF